MGARIAGGGKKENPVMVKIEEKIRLMEEVGMKFAAHNMIKKIEMEKEAKEMSSLKFHPTTEEEIHNKLIRPINHKEKMKRLWTFFGCSMAAIALIVWAVNTNSVVEMNPVKALHTCLGVALLISLPGIWTLNFYTGLDSSLMYLNSTPLQLWEHNIPYGACLAIKEAKQKGLEEFQIWYPSKSPQFKPGDDPVITAKTKYGLMVEVFAWDDGVVYE